LLKEAVPSISQVTILVDPNVPRPAHVLSFFEPEARALGVRLQRVEAGTPAAISAALASLAHSGAEALMIQDSAMFNSHRQQILDVARAQRLPTVCGVRAFAEAGCLIAYAPDLLAMLRRAATFVDKILKGIKPGDIPMEPPHKLTLVVNLKTAQARSPRDYGNSATSRATICFWSGAMPKALSSPLRLRPSWFASGWTSW
jgi:putative ABC transport system substrate-binding protein